MSVKQSVEEHRKEVEKLNKEANYEIQTIGHPSLDTLYKYYDRAIYILEDHEKERAFALSLTAFVKGWCDVLYQNEDDQFRKLYWMVLLWEARNMVLDSYLLYLEKNRIYKDRFYEPRRKCFMKIGLIQGMQDILDDKLDILSISLPPGTGKTTLEKMFHSGICGWFPEDANLFYSHSGDITRMYYEGMYDILTNNQEYTWSEIFPNSKVSGTNAKTEQINIDKYKPFKNVQCTSVGAKNAGKVRAGKFLLCDDLIGSIEEALNNNTLDKLWNTYAVDARQRKLDGCKEIHIATRWSVRDVIGRLQRLYDGNKRCRFIAVPDIDPATGESNFLFDINGFTVDFYNDQAKVMDEISYRCLYKNQPVEREGLLYTDDNIRRYYNLPGGEPEIIYAQCDHKDTGTDYMFMPVLLKYGDDYYCTDCVCSTDPDYENQYANLTDLIVRNKVQSAQFERNQGGGRVAAEVNKRVEEAGWICNITDEPTETNKEARIFQCANWVKQHILFKEKESYTAKSDYGEMMGQLLTYSTQGKNPHDDIPDCFSLFALRVTGTNKTADIEPVFNPFWR